MTDQTYPAALVKAAMERAAEECGGWGYGRLSQVIRALADDPEAVAKIVEQVKGANDG